MFKKRMKDWNLFKNIKESGKEEIIRKPHLQRSPNRKLQFIAYTSMV
jgi:hypothetical protein